jgi:hypothetical protein
MGEEEGEEKALYFQHFQRPLSLALSPKGERGLNGYRKSMVIRIFRYA